MATTVADARITAPAKVSRAGWYALTLVAAAQGLSLLDRQILSILAPNIQAHLGIGPAEMGLLYGTMFALFYALFSLPLGRLADGWIRTRLLGHIRIGGSAVVGAATRDGERRSATVPAWLVGLAIEARQPLIEGLELWLELGADLLPAPIRFAVAGERVIEEARVRFTARLGAGWRFE